MPKRIQRKRSAGWRMPEGAVYVGRPTKWGNPFVIGETYPTMEEGCSIPDGEAKCSSQADATEMFRSWADSEYGFEDEDIDELRGRDLVCWCPLDQPCHADVLIDIANRDETDR